jgi:cytochrome oxidase Cu insertion factor (SCO1/SenC/PrrC family)
MHKLIINRRPFFILVVAALILTACSTPAAPKAEQAAPTENSASKWDWFNIEMTDVRTGETFTMNDFAGKVVLVETMAMWCPNCVVQHNEVRNLHKVLGNPDDLISVSLDVDMNEEGALLKEFAESYAFDWRFAVAPLEVARALGNLYSAEYLNPPLSPMLIIDRDGKVHQLEYGMKSVETLRKNLEPFLAQ